MYIYIIFSINQGLQSSFQIGIIGIVSSFLSLLTTFLLIKKGFKLNSISIGILVGGVVNLLGQLYVMSTSLTKYSIKIIKNFKEVKSIIYTLGQTSLGRMAGILANNLDLIIIIN